MVSLYKKSALKIPFQFEERRPLFLSQFLLVPEFYQNHGPELDLSALFKNDRPVFVEYCSGNGQWIANRAKASLDCNWIAVEKDFERARKIWLKAKNGNLGNLFVVFGEAFCFTRHYLKPFSVAGAFINFPDPWPKRRHAKKRLVSAPFLKLLQEKMQKEALLTMVTDHEKSVPLMAKAALESSFKALFPDPYFINELPEYGLSFFEQLFRGKGGKIHYLQFSNSFS
ncbi:MAG: tRNA (guanine(46)-N(7))-methyltransferase TrmB [Parachlamydiales bacterium]|jgi:tRNA (guanine-N7-)-methyltransferase